MSGPSKKSKKTDKHAIRMEGDMSDDSDNDEDMEEGESDGEELMTPVRHLIIETFNIGHSGE